MATTRLPSIHIDTIDSGNAEAGFPWTLSPNTMIADLTDVDLESLAMNLKRPDGVELVGLPVTIVSSSASAIVMAYRFRTEDLLADPTDASSERLQRCGKYIAYIKGETLTGTDFRTDVAVLTVVDRFTA